MKAVFADTSYYAALLNPDDSLHSSTVHWSQRFTGRIIVTEYVLLELGSYFSRRVHRRLFLRLLDELERDTETVIVPTSAKLLRAGLRLFGDRIDKDWSLTDCISFVVMKQRRISEAVTADHHFQQAGFRALLIYDV